MVGRVGEEGFWEPGTGQGRVIMLGTIDTSFGSSHMGGVWTDFTGHSKVMVLFPKLFFFFFLLWIT